MELTSDMDRRLHPNEDIDIDLDLTGENPQDEEDEYMGEDMNVLTDQTVPNEHDLPPENDDEMADEGYQQGLVSEGSSVHDEDLDDADYVGPDIDENTIVETSLGHTSNLFQGLLENPEQIDTAYNDGQERHEQSGTADGDLATTPGILPDGQQAPSSSIHNVSDLATQKLSQDREDEHDTDGSSGHVQEEFTIMTPGAEMASELEAKSGQPEQGGDSLATSEEEYTTLSTAEEEVQSQVHLAAQDERSLQGAPYIHPVVVVYQDNEISLFPPVDQDQEHSETYFLQDEQLAGENIRNLLAACRSVLGESISEQDELIINVEDLGLQITEVSFPDYLLIGSFANERKSTTECSSTTLSQLLEIYVHLQHHDGLEDPPPLYISLGTKPKFSHRLEFLLNAIVEGKGLSQLVSFEVAEDAKQNEAEGALETEFEDRSSHTDLPINADVPDPELQNRRSTEESHGKSLPSSRSLQERISIMPTSKLPSTASTAGTETNRAAVQLNSKEALNEKGNENYQPDLALHANEAIITSLVAIADATDPQAQNQPTVDEGDFIDYEDDEDLARETSSRSSTLQGDVLEVATSQNHMSSEKPLPSALVYDLEAAGPAQNSTINEGEKTYDIGDTDENSAGAALQKEHCSENVGYQSDHASGEGANSSYELNEEVEKLEDPQDAGNPQSSVSEPTGSANDTEDEPYTKYDDGSTYEVYTFEEHVDGASIETEAVFHTFPHSDREEYTQSDPVPPTDGSDTASNHANPSVNDDAGLRDRQIEREATPPEVHWKTSEKLPAEAKLQSSLLITSSEQPADEDEITYEDEEDSPEPPQTESEAEPKFASSPGPLKRARSLHEDAGALEDVQGVKISSSIDIELSKLTSHLIGAKRVRSE